MHIGTPRTLRHAAGWQHNPELVDHDPATGGGVAEGDPVERVVVVEEPAVPDHVGELDADPVVG